MQELPQEIRLNILRRVAAQTLFTKGINLVCKEWNNLSNDTSVWADYCAAHYGPVSTFLPDDVASLRSLIQQRLRFYKLCLSMKEGFANCVTALHKLGVGFLSQKPDLQWHREHKNELYTLAKDHFEKGNELEAQKLLKAQLIWNPMHEESWYLYGVCEQENDNDNTAMTCFKITEGINPKHTKVLLEMAICNINDMRESEAADRMKLWIKNVFDEEAKTWSEIHQIIARIRAVRTGEWTAEEIDVYVDCHKVLGVMKIADEHDWRGAIEHFKQCIEADPTNYSILNKLGACSANMNSYRAAQDYYERALVIRPHYIRALVNYGISHMGLRNYYAAIYYFCRALVLNPNVAAAKQHMESCFAMSPDSLTQGGRGKLNELRQSSKFEEMLVLLGEHEMHKGEWDAKDGYADNPDQVEDDWMQAYNNMNAGADITRGWEPTGRNEGTVFGDDNINQHPLVWEQGEDSILDNDDPDTAWAREFLTRRDDENDDGNDSEVNDVLAALRERSRKDKYWDSFK